MRRPVYACDRCGHWFTTDERHAQNDLPYEPQAYTFDPSYHLCAKCTAEYRALPDQKLATLAAWQHAGQGAEVKPKSLRRS